ncbi:MAG: NPCBM/NEW2 domain-containing protein, partial [Pirellulales bacterium]|nr:NPCBM/NEW2 domain-containing protein [Pirellulales bacterium]
AKTADFGRGIPKRTIKTLDLVDVVGGDGFSGRRDRGIDSTNGRIIDALSARSVEGGPSTPMTGDGQYHRMAEMPFIDVVFIPDGGGDAVQVDSAGHVFDWFRDTANTTWQHIWAGGAFRDREYPTKFGGVDHASPGHGLVLLHANSAITFNLEAIRRANPGARLLRFRATAANTGVLAGVQFYADVWVLADGQRRFQRRLINNDQGVASVRIPIYDGDRFLTLAATDAGDGISMDWIIFGDPRLELLVVNANKQKSGRPGRDPARPE